MDAVNPVFNTVDDEPEEAGSANWTHVFGPSLVNQFNPGISYQNRVHTLADPVKAHQLPVGELAEFQNGFSSIGGTLGNIPYGNRTTTWQLNDNLSWTVRRHSFKFGENFRRVLVQFGRIGRLRGNTVRISVFPGRIYLRSRLSDV